jgi:hypothetical protein
MDIPRRILRLRVTTGVREMSWVGQWRNQFGSIVEITNDAEHRIEGTFRTALEDSGFYGQEVRILGIHQGDCISFAAGGSGAAGDLLVSYTGLRRNGRMETLWYVVADAAFSVTKAGAPGELKKLSWWRAITTNADTFVRVAGTTR